MCKEKLFCCNTEMEFDPGLWETDGIIEYDCTICKRSIRIERDNNCE